MDDIKLLNKNCIAIIVACILGIVYSIVTFSIKTPVLADEMIDSAKSLDAEGLLIPLPTGTSFEDAAISTSLFSLKLIIPGDDKDFYYQNTLKGNSANISGLSYGYIDNHHVFDVGFEAASDCLVSEQEGEISVKIEPILEKYDQIVVIDPLHGGEDTGTVSYSIVESYVNYNAAVALMEKLREAGIGAYITRGINENPSKEERLNYVNQLDANLYIGISCNADKKTRVSSGTEVLLSSELNSVYTALSKENAFDIKQTNFLDRDLDVPQMDIYLGYLTNKADALMLSDKDEVDNRMSVFAKAIEESEVLK